MKQKIIKKKKISIKSLISFFILFGFIMQSGGGLLRTGALGLLIVSLFICSSFNATRFSKKTLFFYLYIVQSITISAVSAAFQDVGLGSIIAFNFSMYLFFILYLGSIKGLITIDGYLRASVLFSFVIILIGVATFLKIPYIEELKPKLIEIFNGIWGAKAFGPIILWIVYFQGTLALIPTCIYCLYIKNNIYFFICFFGLLFSGSRFGILVILLFYLFFNIRKLLKVFFVFGIFFLIGMITNNPIINSLLSMFNDSDGGVSIRMGHLIGIMELLEKNPYYLIVGQGPGSVFYSYGFNNFIDTCEISQFDFLRKYGLPFTTIVYLSIFVFAFLLIKNTDKKGKAIGWGIVAHFFVAISNPVLTSLPFMSFLAISCSYYYTYRKNKRGK